jgi:uroporphyrinogen III methyltransferase/synthase
MSFRPWGARTAGSSRWGRLEAVSHGKVWLIGAGPGDPELITVRGRELLARADVVLHDALVHPALLEACAQAELHDVGKRYGEESVAQETINQKLIELARAGKRVVRLKGGDPFLFARGAEEALALARAGVAFEIVPGISSPVAATAYAGISLTHRELSSSATLITGSDRAGKEWSVEAWRKLATATDTICVLMGMRRIEAITQAIMDGGRDELTPAAVIQWGARPEQRVLVGTLADIAARARAAGLKNPALIVIGEVVRLRNELSWYDAQPLFGKRVLVPRPGSQALATAKLMRERGAEPIVFPVIEITDPEDAAPLARAVHELGRYDWVLFTSANGVERFFLELARAGRDARAFAAARLGVIGPSTAEALHARGLQADVVAEEHVGEGLARAVIAQGPPRHVLLPRAAAARDALPAALRDAGASVDVVAAYAARPITGDRALRLRELVAGGALDIVLFTAGSTVRAMVDALGPNAAQLLRGLTVASIGPITSEALASYGIAVDVTAQTYTLPGLLDALERHFA